MLPLPIKSHHHLQAQGIPRNLHLPLFLWRSNSHPDPYNPHRSGCVMKQKAGHIPDLFSVDERSHNLHSTSPGFCRPHTFTLWDFNGTKKIPNKKAFQPRDFVQFSGSMLIGLNEDFNYGTNQITKKNPTKCPKFWQDGALKILQPFQSHFAQLDVRMPKGRRIDSSIADPRKNLVQGSKFWILSMCLEVETKTLQFRKQPCW